MQQYGYWDRKHTMGPKALLLVALMGLASVLAGHRSSEYIPGAPVNISKDDVSLQRVILNATDLYNNQSNDAFLFRASAIIRAQRQIVKGVNYFIDFQISRTVCRKQEPHRNLSRCAFQPRGVLYQTFQCHFEAWLIPWENVAHVKFLTCKP